MNCRHPCKRLKNFLPIILLLVLLPLTQARAQKGASSDQAQRKACRTNADCADKDLCNGTEICSGGICKPGTPIPIDDKDPCTADSCNSADGKVKHAAIPGCCRTNADCDDKNACNGREICEALRCRQGIPLSIDDRDVCTKDNCDPKTGQVIHSRIQGCTPSPTMPPGSVSPPSGAPLPPTAIPLLPGQLSGLGAVVAPQTPSAREPDYCADMERVVRSHSAQDWMARSEVDSRESCATVNVDLSAILGNMCRSYTAAQNTEGLYPGPAAQGPQESPTATAWFQHLVELNDLLLCFSERQYFAADTALKNGMQYLTDAFPNVRAVKAAQSLANAQLLFLDTAPDRSAQKGLWASQREKLVPFSAGYLLNGVWAWYFIDDVLEYYRFRSPDDPEIAALIARIEQTLRASSSTSAAAESPVKRAASWLGRLLGMGGKKAKEEGVAGQQNDTAALPASLAVQLPNNLQELWELILADESNGDGCGSLVAGLMAMGECCGSGVDCESPEFRNGVCCTMPSMAGGSAGLSPIAEMFASMAKADDACSLVQHETSTPGFGLGVLNKGLCTAKAPKIPGVPSNPILGDARFVARGVSAQNCAPGKGGAEADDGEDDDAAKKDDNAAKDQEENQKAEDASKKSSKQYDVTYRGTDTTGSTILLHERKGQQGETSNSGDGSGSSGTSGGSTGSRDRGDRWAGGGGDGEEEGSGGGNPPSNNPSPNAGGRPANPCNGVAGASGGGGGAKYESTEAESSAHLDRSSERAIGDYAARTAAESRGRSFGDVAARIAAYIASRDPAARSWLMGLCRNCTHQTDIEDALIAAASEIEANGGDHSEYLEDVEIREVNSYECGTPCVLAPERYCPGLSNPLGKTVSHGPLAMCMEGLGDLLIPNGWAWVEQGKRNKLDVREARASVAEQRTSLAGAKNAYREQNGGDPQKGSPAGVMFPKTDKSVRVQDASLRASGPTNDQDNVRIRMSDQQIKQLEALGGAGAYRSRVLGSYSNNEITMHFGDYDTLAHEVGHIVHDRENGETGGVAIVVDSSGMTPQEFETLKNEIADYADVDPDSVVGVNGPVSAEEKERAAQAIRSKLKLIDRVGVLVVELPKGLSKQAMKNKIDNDLLPLDIELFMSEAAAFATEAILFTEPPEKDSGSDPSEPPMAELPSPEKASSEDDMRPLFDTMMDGSGTVEEQWRRFYEATRKILANRGYRRISRLDPAKLPIGLNPRGKYSAAALSPAVNAAGRHLIQTAGQILNPGAAIPEPPPLSPDSLLNDCRNSGRPSGTGGSRYDTGDTAIQQTSCNQRQSFAEQMKHQKINCEALAKVQDLNAEIQKRRERFAQPGGAAPIGVAGGRQRAPTGSGVGSRSENTPSDGETGGVAAQSCDRYTPSAGQSGSLRGLTGCGEGGLGPEHCRQRDAYAPPRPCGHVDCAEGQTPDPNQDCRCVGTRDTRERNLERGKGLEEKSRASSGLSSGQAPNQQPQRASPQRGDQNTGDVSRSATPR